MDSLNRIIEEFKDLNRNPLSNCGVIVGLFEENNYRKWRFSLLGPKDSSYKGGLFCLGCEFPEKYPKEPPEIYYMTPIYHLNVNPKAPKDSDDEPLGHVSISTLNWWKPEYTIREVFMNIYYLFYIANPESAYGLDRADEFRNDRATYEAKAKYFTEKYATPFKAYKPYDRTKDWDFNI